MQTSISGPGGSLFDASVVTSVQEFDCCRMQTFGATGVLATGIYTLELAYREGITSTGGFPEFGGGVIGNFGLHFELPEPSAVTLLVLALAGVFGLRLRQSACITR